MNQIKYQGYARDRGFNPIQVSTASVDAIAEQGNSLLRQMKENNAYEAKSREEYMAGLRTAKGYEQQSRERNFQLRSTDLQNQQQAELRALEVKNANFQRQQQALAQSAEVLAPLVNFSKTITEAVVAWKKQKNEEERMQGYVDAYINGPNPAKELEVEAGKSYIRKTDEVIQTTADKLEDTGAPPEAVRAVRRLSKWEQIGRTQAVAEMAVGSYPGFLQEAYDTDDQTQIQFVNPDTGEVKIITPRTAFGRDEKAAVNKFLFKQFIKQQGLLGINPDFLAPSLKAMKQYENQVLDQEGKAYSKAQNESALSETLYQLDVGVNSDPISAANEAMRRLRHISDENGVRISPLKAFQTVVDHFVKTGNREALQSLEGSESYMKNVPWGEARKVEFRDAYRKIDGQRADDEALQDRLGDQEFENWSDSIIQELTSVEGGADEATVQQAIEKSRELYNGKVDPRLTQYAENLTLQARDIKDQETQLNLLAQNDELTVEELESGKYNWKLRERFRAAAEQGSRTMEAQSKGFRDTYKKAISDSLMLNAGVTGYNDKKVIPTFYFAEAHALKQLDARARIYANSGKPLDEAYSMAAQDLMQEIEKDRGPDKFGTYAFTSSGEFRRWSSQGSGGKGAFSKAKANVSSIIQQINSGGTAAITGRKLLSIEQAQALDDVNAPIPEIIGIMANALPKGKSMSAFDIIDAQRSLHGLPPRQRPYVQMQVDSTLSPRLQELLNRTPTAMRTRRALTGGGLVGPGQDRQAIGFIAQSLGVDPVDVATFINYETGGNLVSGQYRRGLDRWGGDGGNYLGWIQFSPENQKQYGVRPGMSSMEMAQAVVKYFKNAGIKPGDNLDMLYQAVQAPAYLERARAKGGPIGADSNGSIASHLDRMRREHRSVAGEWLMDGAPVGGSTSTFRDPRLMSAPARKLLKQYQMTSGFGASEPFRGGKTHGGNDYATPANTKLSFKQPGVVIDVGDPNADNGGYGGFIKVRLQDGSEVLLAHLNKVKVRKGQRLGAKQIAALSGNTGRSTGDHTHLEAYDRQGRKQNPSWIASQIYADI